MTWRRIAAWPRSGRAAIVLLLLAVLPPLLTRIGVLPDLWALRLGTGAVLAAAALSLNLLLGYTGQISLGQFTLVGIGAFAGALLTNPLKADLPFAVALPLAGLIGALAGLIIGLPALRLRGLSLAIASIGVAFVGDETLFKLPVLGGSAGIEAPRPYFGDTPLLRYADYLAVILVVLALLWLLDGNITRTKIGRAFQGIRADEKVAASYGVDTASYTLLAFVLSGFMAAIAGALGGALTGTVNPEGYAYQLSLSLVVLVVIGGLGSRLGALISAFAFTLITPVVFEPLLGDNGLGLAPILGGVLLVLTLALHPGGISSALQERREKRLAALRGDDELTTGAIGMPRPTGLQRRLSVRPGRPLLEVSGVTVRFGGLTAVDDAGLAVNRQSICALVGPNGAGKSTLFDVITGVRSPDAGTVRFAGTDITALPPFRRSALGIGRTFQQIGLARDLSVIENLLLAQHTQAAYSVGEALGFLGRASRVEQRMREAAREAVAALGFERYADTPVKFLSGGQQRLVEIGATLVTAPELVLLDEPSAGFSPAAAEALALRLADIRDQLGRTVLLIEHNIPLVLDVADELVVLDAGAVVADGEPVEVVERPEVVEAYLGKGYDDPAEEPPPPPAPRSGRRRRTAEVPA